MNSLTELLTDFLHQFSLRSIRSEYSRLMLGGLPNEVLEDLFGALTRGDGSPWQPTEGIQIPVFLVTRDPESDETGPSRKCNWDFALAVRNSFPNFLLLVDPFVWDERTYSIINATEAIGTPLPPVRRNVPALKNWSEFYANVVEMAAKRIGIEYSIVETAVRETLRELPVLDPSHQQLLPWQIVGRVSSLSNSNYAPSPNDIARVCGLLPFESDGHDFRRSKSTLKRLAEFLEKTGIKDGVEELKLTSRGNDLRSELDVLGTHLRGSAGSASAFVRAPSFYYFSQGPESKWWSSLTVEVVDEMLAEMGLPADAEKISVSCVEPLNRTPAPDEPFLVQERAIIEVRHPEGAFQSIKIWRRLRGHGATMLASESACQSPFRHEDTTIPAHKEPIKYSAEAYGATPDSVQVICLANYEPRGFVTCPGTSTRKISKPRKPRNAERWQQEIFLLSGGIKVLRTFCGSRVSKVRITEPSEYKIDSAVIGGTADLQVDLDEDVEIALDLMGPDERVISAFTISIAIDQDQGETVPSQFHALVRSHQEIKSTASVTRSKESWLRGAENELLLRDHSWNPILATNGWTGSKPLLTETRLLGNLQPQVDPRPVVNPPSKFSETRAEVVNWLRSSQVPIPEADLANEKAYQLATDYLSAYRDWGECAPAEACWVDTISILEREPEQIGSQVVAATEPVAVLISPLHPIRFGWHVAAQRVLSSGLDSPCPLAGLLDPHRCPEVLSLALTRSGGEPSWKSYVSISCEDAMWGLFWNAGRLRDMQQHEAVTELVVAGVVPRGVQSGFTASQARRTLEELSHVLPTRAILRLGIIGSEQGSTSCTEGLIAWSCELYDKESEQLAGPRSIEIYDSRSPESQPSSEEISSLADDT